MKNKKKFLLFIIIVFFAIFTRFNSVENFFVEIDGLISLEKLKYEKLDLYDIAKDPDSLSYNSKIKKYIRELETRDNIFIDYTQKKIANLISNLSPSKTSTYAPLQFLMFGWMLNLEQNFDQLKFYSRLPSVIFSFLTIFMVYLISRNVFKNNFYLIILPVLLINFSYPLIFISQKSYNYSAGIFGICLTFYLFLRENLNLDAKKIFIENYKLKIKKNFYLALILSITSYLSYLSLVLMPSFFIFKFLRNYFHNKQFFSFTNYNLIICGLFYSTMILPLLIHMLRLNLQNYGALDASGIDGEYSIQGKNGEYVEFYLYNFYLIVAKNLSFFLDNFTTAKIIQAIIFLVTILGLVGIFTNKTENIEKVFIYMFVFKLFYWCFFVFFNQTTFGPTRQLLWLTPLIAIIFTLGIKNINNFLFKSYNFFPIIIIFSITFIFFINYSNFVNYHKDLLTEKKLNALIKKYNIKYIVSNSSVAQFCYMKSIKVTINLCPKRYYRHTYIAKIDEKLFEQIKKEQGSIAFVNYNFTNQNKLDLSNNNFKVFHIIEDIKYLSEAPMLYVAKQSPNFIKIKIYK